MAISVNKVILLGNLGQDPDVRATPSGKQVSTIRMATSRKYKDQSGEWQENTEWHSVVLWGWLADNAAQYLKKGSKVYIEGRLQTRNYEGKDGVTRYVTEVVADNMVMLDGRKSDSDGSYNQGSNRGGKVSDNYSQASPQDDFDEEVPF